jgi:hypothetical protein
MTAPFTPERWAFEITHVLNAAFGAERFPIAIPMIAREYSKQRFPDDPIVSVHGDDLPTFDGALFKAKAGRKGWGIIYNNAITSKGRINFTLAHEFGHYLLHRLAYPNGFQCGQQQIPLCHRGPSCWSRGEQVSTIPAACGSENRRTK